MKERPIIFSDEMVRKILSGAKTMTRRVLKFQPKPEHTEIRVEPFSESESLVTYRAYPNRGSARHSVCSCPYGIVGSRLYVKENFWKDIRDPNGCVIYSADDAKFYKYRLDSLNKGVQKCEEGHSNEYLSNHKFWRKCSSRFMPRWASRITLKLLDIKVERVQDIAEADALAEGFDKKTCAEVFKKVMSKKEMKYGRWLETKKIRNSLDGDWCVDCIDKAAKKHNADIDGWNDYPEQDSPRWCEACGALLTHSLTEYGVELELDICNTGDTEKEARERMPVSGESATILHNLADGIGDLQEKHLCRLAQIGFATNWNILNGKRNGGIYAWEKNPFVFALTFKRVEK
jgi:hypothetical protein